MARRFYGSANSEAKFVSELYGGSNSGAKNLSKLYGASAQHINTTYFIAVDEEKFIQAMHDRSSFVPLDALSTNPYATLERTAQNAWRVYLRPKTGGSYYYVQFSTFANFASAFEEALTWTQNGQALLETALSVVAAAEDLFNSSVAALVHQGFGHVDNGYGSLVYYTDSTKTTTNTIKLLSQEEVNQLGNNSPSWSATIQGLTIGCDDIKSCILTDKVTSLPDDFLRRCQYLDHVDFSSTRITTLPVLSLSSPISSLTHIGKFPSTLTTIGNSALSTCTKLKQDITLPPSLTSLGWGCLSHFSAYGPVINVGNLDASIAATNQYTFCVNSRSSQAYIQGVKIAGANRSAWLARFPNSPTSSPYRNLVDAGY